MSKKVLNTQSVINELKGQSAYFRQGTPAQPDKAESETVETAQKEPIKRPKPNTKKEGLKAIPKPEHSPAELPNKTKNDTVGSNISTRASTPASMQAFSQDDIVETIRKTVKQVGKDTLFVRLTAAEKRQITSVVYAFNEMYRGEGRKTSENEIGRISVSFLLEDYKANGKESILAKVLAALNA